MEIFYEQVIGLFYGVYGSNAVDGVGEWAGIVVLRDEGDCYGSS